MMKAMYSVHLLPRLSRLHLLKEELGLRELDFQFAHFILQQEESLSGSKPNNEPKWDVLATFSCVLSYELSKGNVCLDFGLLGADPSVAIHPYLQSKDIEQDLNAILSCEVVTNVTNPSSVAERKPLVVDERRVYLQRYWHYEFSLAKQIQQRLTGMPWYGDEGQIQPVRSMLNHLFKLDQRQSSDDLDWQAVSAFVASQKQFSVISGGPGTGKTTTVIRLLAVLVELYQQKNRRVPIIKLAAPTGKAAMRLSESIKGAKQKLDVEPSIKQAIPEEASTLHRLLKQGQNGEFQHNCSDPLHLDVLIVDEASMVDLPLMSKLMEALPKSAQVILLGDKDQLASVEAGSVLGDICDSGQHHGYSLELNQAIECLPNINMPADFKLDNGMVIRDHLCNLRKSYRFHENSGIGHLARAANNGDFQQWTKVVNQNYDDLNIWSSDLASVEDQLIKQALHGYSAYLSLSGKSSKHDEKSALEIHQSFNDFQILCALREGESGVSGLNHLVEQALSHARLIHRTEAGFDDANHKPDWYAGRPVMIMENDYALNLFNGDIGIALLAENEVGDPVLKVSFVTADGQVRWVKPSRLPKHETVYAMTIHKSQGSEFKHCLMVLPAVMVDVLNKELIYTGITRAKEVFTLLAQDQIVRRSLQKRVQRASGLRVRLWGPTNQSSEGGDSGSGSSTTTDKQMPEVHSKPTSSTAGQDQDSNPGEQLGLF